MPSKEAVHSTDLQLRHGVALIVLTFVIPILVCSMFGCSISDLEIRAKSGSLGSTMPTGGIQSAPVIPLIATP
jgi:hypothetical protein